MQLNMTVEQFQQQAAQKRQNMVDTLNAAENTMNTGAKYVTDPTNPSQLIKIQGETPIQYQSDILGLAQQEAAYKSTVSTQNTGLTTQQKSTVVAGANTGAEAFKSIADASAAVNTSTSWEEAGIKGALHYVGAKTESDIPAKNLIDTVQGQLPLLLKSFLNTGRIGQYELSQVQNTMVPTVWDSKQVADSKLNMLKNYINNLYTETGVQSPLANINIGNSSDQSQTSQPAQAQAAQQAQPAQPTNPVLSQTSGLINSLTGGQ